MTVSSRLETPDDEPYVRQLVIASVAAELHAESWPEPMRSHLLGIQYTSRRNSAHSLRPAAQAYIILADDHPAGWFVVDSTGEHIWLVDIIVAAGNRGKGIGSAILGELASESDRSRRPIGLSVRLANPGAIRLYERHGFVRVGGDEIQQVMERPARTASAHAG